MEGDIEEYGEILGRGTMVTQKGHGNMVGWGHSREKGDDDMVGRTWGS